MRREKPAKGLPPSRRLAVGVFANKTPPEWMVREALRCEKHVQLIRMNAPEAIIGHRPRPTEVKAYMTLSEVRGRGISPEQLRDQVGKYSWSEMFLRLARIAAVAANTPSGYFGREVAKLTHTPLAEHDKSPNPAYWAIANYARRHWGHRPIAHEQAVYTLQAMAILYGADSGKAPSDSAVAFLLLAINDYHGKWARERENVADDLPVIKRLVAELAYVTRFNRLVDGVRLVTRSALLLASPPPRGRLADANEWKRFQLRACGAPFEQYFDEVVVPLMVQATLWGSSPEHAWPVLTPETFYSQSVLDPGLGRNLLQEVTTGRDALRERLASSLDTDGLPRVPAALLREPLVELGDGRACAISPHAVHQFLRFGLWARHLEAAKAQSDPDLWFGSWGDLVEQWCRRVAQEAAQEPAFRGRLALSKLPGDDDEIEDVVVLDDGAVMLFSVKGMVLRESLLSGKDGLEKLLSWYEEFMFSAGQRRKRGRRKKQPGAIRLLNTRADAIRHGAYSQIPSESQIIPVVVLYDDPGESPALYRWLDERCESHGLFQQADVLPVTVIGIADYEGLMGFASTGQSLVEMLRLKSTPTWRERRLDQLLWRISRRSDSSPRVPSIAAAFDEVMEGALVRLFGRDPTDEV